MAFSEESVPVRVTSSSTDKYNFFFLYFTVKLYHLSYRLSLNLLESEYKDIVGRVSDNILTLALPL